MESFTVGMATAAFIIPYIPVRGKLDAFSQNGEMARVGSGRCVYISSKKRLPGCGGRENCVDADGLCCWWICGLSSDP